MSYYVSVIIPVYNVSHFIRRCAESLFNQSLDNIEYIFVDDCSSDNSILILEEVIQCYSNKNDAIKLIRHNVNQGLPSARNTGLKHATGEFIFHCDSDDWLESDALELLYNRACQKDVDIVYCDWYLSFENSSRYMSQGYGNSSDVMDGTDVIKLMLGGRLKYNVWNKLVRRSLYTNNQIFFPDGYSMGEDMTMIKLFSFTTKVSYLSSALYHYVQTNNGALTKKKADCYLEQISYNVNDIVCFIRDRYFSALDEDIHFFKLNVKFPFLISAQIESYERWNRWYVDSNIYIDKNPLFSLRSRLLQKAALYRQYWFLKLHYLLIVRFFYGCFYK